jgi:hypothetical protein
MAKATFSMCGTQGWRVRGAGHMTGQAVARTTRAGRGGLVACTASLDRGSVVIGR